MAAFDRELVLALIPCSKQTILENERKRGVGNDTRLRYNFERKLTNYLGPSEPKCSNEIKIMCISYFSEHHLKRCWKALANLERSI